MQELLNECKKAYEERDYSGLEQACNRILEKDKKNEIALGYKIFSLAWLEKNEEVLECADYAIRLYPNNFMFYFEKAETLLWAFDDVDGAIETYEKGLSLVEDFDEHWFSVDNIIYALYKKAGLLMQSGNFKGAIDICDRILFYRPSEFKALDCIESIVKEHDIDYEASRNYEKSLDLRKRSRKRAEKIEDCLNGIEIGEYGKDYINGFCEFKDYNSLDEYIRDLIICLMESYPYRSEDHARSLVKCNMDYIRSSYEHKEPIAYCSIEVGYCCG